MTQPVDRYGIAANLVEIQAVFRRNGPCRLIGGKHSVGWHRFQWRAMGREMKMVMAWVATEHFVDFRPARISIGWPCRYIEGTKEEMQVMAKRLETFARRMRRERDLSNETTPK